GTFTVARLSFSPVGLGSSNLTLTVTSLTDTNGAELPRPPADVHLSSNSIKTNRLLPPPPPSVASITPNSGFRSATTNVTLSGGNFVPGSTTIAVSGSGVTATILNIASDTSLTA